MVDIVYIFTYRNVEGYLIETDELSKEQFYSYISDVLRDGGRIVETWKYVNGEFSGRPEYR